MRCRSSISRLSAARVFLVSVRSRTVLDAPMIAPDGALIGDTLSETGTVVPSLRNRTVS